MFCRQILSHFQQLAGKQLLDSKTYMVLWGTWQRHRRPSLDCMTLNWVHSSFQPGGECIGGSWGLHLKEKRNKEHKYYTGGQSVSQCATGSPAKAKAVRQGVPGARLQRLCLHSGESVADWPAANSRATLRAKTSSFILPYSGAARERETGKTVLNSFSATV